MASVTHSGGLVSNTWIICLAVWDIPWKHGAIPDAKPLALAGGRKGAKALLQDESASH